jgi:uncharacterized protein YllA (UPF0747 family)
VVLRAQQAPGREAQLDALARPGTVVVVTGQQVGLFLGPLYSLYKAATAVSVARALEQETGVRCVPVFWLQSEDHDFDEIDHCHVHARDGALVKLRLVRSPGSRSARASTRRSGCSAKRSKACRTQTRCSRSSRGTTAPSARGCRRSRA